MAQKKDGVIIAPSILAADFSHEIEHLLHQAASLPYPPSPAALARLEARVALEETLARFPTWEVDEDEVRYVHTNTVRGPASVPIRL